MQQLSKKLGEFKWKTKPHLPEAINVREAEEVTSFRKEIELISVSLRNVHWTIWYDFWWLITQNILRFKDYTTEEIKNSLEFILEKWEEDLKNIEKISHILRLFTHRSKWWFVSLQQQLSWRLHHLKRIPISYGSDLVLSRGWTITPTKIEFDFPRISMINRVLRKFPANYFLNVNFALDSYEKAMYLEEMNGKNVIYI